MSRLSCIEAQFKLEEIKELVLNLQSVIGEYAKTSSDTSKKTAQQIKHLLIRETKELRKSLELASWQFHVKVDYDQFQPSLEELKTQFDHVFENGFRNVSFKHIDNLKDQIFESGEIPFKLFEIKEEMKAENIIKNMDKEGLRPATYEELLSFAKSFPDEQKKYYIVALGSVDDFKSVPYLYWTTSKRTLSLEMSRDLCWPDNRFLATRKVPS
jgi:hypothetical protein